MAWTLDKLYSRVKAGNFCSTNTDGVMAFGGGLAGCQIAVHLGMPGKKLHIAEMRDNSPPTPMCATVRCS